ncbi:MAG: DUF952 domain-containing protein [Williamsia sp.]|nr:DUF952 domain-containing protein [Williamsia sp.]
MILHVTTRPAWQQAQEKGSYTAPSLEHEGFIHCCGPGQLEGVLDRYYPDRQNLLVLYIEESLLTSPLKYEPSPLVNESFPHIYGAINLEAVQTTEALVR